MIIIYSTFLNSEIISRTNKIPVKNAVFDQIIVNPYGTVDYCVDINVNMFSWSTYSAISNRTPFLSLFLSKYS